MFQSIWNRAGMWNVPEELEFIRGLSFNYEVLAQLGSVLKMACVQGGLGPYPRRPCL
jgi:hypothetical protein